MEKKLLDESEEVKKLFESFCCKYPVTDIKKVKRHWAGTITGLATVQIVIAIFLKRIWLIISRSALTL